MYINPYELKFFINVDNEFIAFSLHELIMGFKYPELRAPCWNKLMELLHSEKTKIRIIEDSSTEKWGDMQGWNDTKVIDIKRILIPLPSTFLCPYEAKYTLVTMT